MSDRRRHVLESILPVVIITLCSAGILVLIHESGEDVIRENAGNHLLRVMDGMITADYNNEIYQDYTEIDDPASPGSSGTTRVYRARLGNHDVGVIYFPVIARGYNGPIKLAISIGKQGTIMAVRAVEQNESSGLGDQIDTQKSGWIAQFSDHSLNDITVQQWRIKNDGGLFDAISGATITSREVTHAVRHTLEHYQTHSDILYK